MATPCTPLNIRPLDCDTDSITVCLQPGASVSGTFTQAPLDCATDSVTICPDPGNPINVNIVNDAPLVAEDDPHVSGDLGRNIYGVRNDLDAVFTSDDLDYSPIATDDAGAVKVVSGQTPLNVDVVNTVELVDVKHPGVEGTVVAGSRWQQYLLGGIGVAPVLSSPIPTGSQRIVVDWLIVTGLVAAPLAVSVSEYQIVNTDGAPPTIYWGTGAAIPLLAGGVVSFDSAGVVVHGEVGEQLDLFQVAAVAALQTSLSWGGYIVEV